MTTLLGISGKAKKTRLKSSSDYNVEVRVLVVGTIVELIVISIVETLLSTLVGQRVEARVNPIVSIVGKDFY